MAQPLVLPGRFFSDSKDRLIPGHTHPFKDGYLAGHREKIADGCEGIFEVIQESKTKDNIEFSKGLNLGIFRVLKTEF
jgi:hypothetical protein